jgi:F-type H+-transporting ATPase subunit epsilon
MKLNLIAQDKIVYEGEIFSVTLPGEEGELTILPGHIPLVTSLIEGKIKIRDKDKKELSFEIESGILEVSPDEVNVLISTVLLK